MTLRVAIRADASTELGAGHVVRCLVLADRLRARGARSFFLCRPGPGDGIAAIQAAGHTVLGLPAGAVEPACDAAACLAALHAAAAGPLDWIVADHYALDARWERTLRAATGARVMAIDGQANRPHDADLLLDPVGLPGSEPRWQGLLPAACRRLIGPGHALLREEFRSASALPAARDGAPPRILLCFGGSDAPDATGRVLAALCGHPQAGAVIDAVIGTAYPHGAALATLAAAHPAVTLHRQPEALARLMRRAHLAVCAGGGTLLELCALQVPALVVSIADNQRGPAQALARAGCAIDLGPLASLDPGQLRRTVAALLADGPRRQAMRAAQAALMAVPAHDVVEHLYRPGAVVGAATPQETP
ncbi:MAG TPA: UDP-2,4-diacetamido-2,4,6-trideoxy-beta-L-altropyranose hydrolase [Ideonella sp.]|nr:UDP-2,4-diacetamido-2,4,6-trideoxy-beta-L-altropyranose hydrolase [Ideonella sp.]